MAATSGIRVLAPDLERFVCSDIADHLHDRVWAAGLLSQGAQPRLVKSLIDAAAELAESISSQDSGGEDCIAAAAMRR